MERLVLTHLARRGQASYASSTDQWLFPGGIPGRHLVTENFRSQLVQRGIQPSDARKAAMLHLASQMPFPVLADVLGRTPPTPPAGQPSPPATGPATPPNGSPPTTSNAQVQ